MTKRAGTKSLRMGRVERYERELIFWIGEEKKRIEWQREHNITEVGGNHLIEGLSKALEVLRDNFPELVKE